MVNLVKSGSVCGLKKIHPILYPRLLEVISTSRLDKSLTLIPEAGGIYQTEHDEQSIFYMEFGCNNF